MIGDARNVMVMVMCLCWLMVLAVMVVWVMIFPNTTVDSTGIFSVGGCGGGGGDCDEYIDNSSGDRMYVLGGRVDDDDDDDGECRRRHGVKDNARSVNALDNNGREDMALQHVGIERQNGIQSKEVDVSQYNFVPIIQMHATYT